MEVPSTVSSLDIQSGATVDEIETAQAALRARMEMLQEVDLRQLGDKMYAKKKVSSKGKGGLDTSNIMWEKDTHTAAHLLDANQGGAEEVYQEWEGATAAKRVRKERVVMLDGKGTGYGGAVPVLASTIDKVPDPASAAAAAAPRFQRGRQWTHMSFCAFCGKRRKPDTMCRCAHCPRIFHSECMESKGLVRGSGMFICPHHKCASCSRSTASAGGMLFRCTSCLTAYCEDCLPQDEIESLGRCRTLEALGYDSKQSYYIKCPACCLTEGVVAKGVDGDADQKNNEVEKEEEEEYDAEDEEEEGDEGEEEEEEEVTKGKSRGGSEKSKQGNVVGSKDGGDKTAGSKSSGGKGKKGKAAAEEEAAASQPALLPSQGMRVYWDEEPDSEEERAEKQRQKEEAKRAERQRKKEEKEREKREREEEERKKREKEEERRRSKSKGKGVVSKSPAANLKLKSRGKVEVEVKGKGKSSSSSSGGGGSKGAASASRASTPVKNGSSSRDSHKRGEKEKEREKSGSKSGSKRRRGEVEEEEEDEEDEVEVKKAGKGSGTGSSQSRASNATQGTSTSKGNKRAGPSVVEEEDDEVEDEEVDIEIPDAMDPGRALAILFSHPRQADLDQHQSHNQSQGRDGDRGRDRASAATANGLSLMTILTKVDNGKQHVG
jgi:hypothetical protein